MLRINVNTLSVLYLRRNDVSSGEQSVRRRPTSMVRTSFTYFILRLNQRRADGREISGRNASAASS